MILTECQDLNGLEQALLKNTEGDALCPQSLLFFHPPSIQLLHPWPSQWRIISSFLKSESIKGACQSAQKML